MFCLLNRFRSPVIRHCCSTLSQANIRSISLVRKRRNKHLSDPELHKLVYTFKYVRITSGVFSSKLYYPIGSAVLGSWISIYYNSWGLLAPVIVSSVLHLTFVNLVAKLLDNVVGAVFVNKEGDVDEVIISSIDSWGRRVDRKHKLEDIVVLPGSRALTLAGFFVVAIENSDIKYKDLGFEQPIQPEVHFDVSKITRYKFHKMTNRFWKNNCFNPF